MRKIMTLIGALAMASCAQPALAQASYPTAASGVRVAGVVPLQCNASGAACAPITATNPAGPSQVVGNVASAATDSGNPVKIGGVYLSNPPGTLVSGQRADLTVDVYQALSVNIAGVSNAPIDSNTASIGVSNRAAPGSAVGLALNVQGHYWNGTNVIAQRGDTNGAVVQPALSSTFWNYPAASTGIVNSTTAVTVKAAAGAGVRNYVCTLAIDHDALGVATEFAVRDGAAGTVMARFKLQTAMNEGRIVTFSPCLKGTANTLVEVVTLTASVTGGTYANLSGYTGN